MKNFLNKIIIKRHQVIVDEENVMNTIKGIRKFTNPIYDDLRLLNCGWDNKRAWTITFIATNSDWIKIINKLNIKRVYYYTEVSQNDLINNVYSNN